MRVKVWTPEGTIIYSDEPRIVGETFELGEEERSVLVAPTTHAEVSDLTRPENRYETELRQAPRGVPAGVDAWR